ncbi:MAG: DUF4870 domain-containing protein [Anaerolineae bacterium]|nr:DUF4870 domain-containing protein [Anaerolineae bacterium]
MVDQGIPEPMAAMPGGPEVTSNDKTMAALTYILPFIGSAIVLLSETNKARPFQRFHAMQGLGLAVVYVIWQIVAFIIGAILGAITAALACCVSWVLPLLPLVPMVYFAYQSYQGKVFDVPVLTDFMVQQGWMERI